MKKDVTCRQEGQVSGHGHESMFLSILKDYEVVEGTDNTEHGDRRASKYDRLTQILC